MTRPAPLLGRIALWTVAAPVVAVTLTPLWDTNLWWVRFWDFPRLQIVAVAVLVLVAALFVRGPTRLVLPLAMALCGGYQLWRILPYTPLAATEMDLAEDGPGAVRIMSSNVLMENDRHDLLIARIGEVDPDILFLMETDRTWLAALEPVLARYDTVVRVPQDDHYGLVFATRLVAETTEIVHLTGDDTPTLLAQLRTSEGAVFRFVGLHPRPPVPGQGTADRDAEIYLAARFARQAGMPLVATGDFNDVAWSDTSRTFKHLGGYLDPRIGRGFYASFDAERWWLRFPIDQLYATPDVAIVSIGRLGYVGSDHFPMTATFRVDAALAGGLNTAPEPVSESEAAIVERAIEAARPQGEPPGPGAMP